jgi:hypothetical protein
VLHSKVTLLRDPVDRVLSLYYYSRGLERHHNAITWAAQTLSLEDFIKCEYPFVQAAIENAQTWQLCYDSNYTARCKMHELSDDDVLEKAKENLAAFDVVGTLERLDDTVKKLCGVFGWDKTEIPHINKTADRPKLDEISQGVRELIESKVMMDRELHRCAEKHLEAN